MEKLNRDIGLYSFSAVYNWIVGNHPTEREPVYIPKCEVKSDKPFRVWHFAGALLLMGNENDKNIHQYILTREMWNQFCVYVRKHPEMNRSELAKHFRDYGCTDKAFWPSIIHICKEYKKDNNLD